jgi:quercetin dioxygenase-like cupin family protein
MEAWDLDHRVDDGGRSGPQVLFSTPEARMVVLDLAAGDVVGEHQVRERLTMLVLAGRVELASGGSTRALGRGTLALFEPAEAHAVRALEPTRLLLTLAPWPAPDHYAADEHEDPHELPANATLPPAS